MTKLNEQPSPDVRNQLHGLVENLPFNERIPRRSGDVTFDEAWEIRVFSIATALHTDGQFEWDEFQSRLINSIKQWESEHTSTRGWSYYERWMIALEELMRDKVLVSDDELDLRTEQVLAAPRNAHHQHATREPIAISTARTANPEESVQ